MNQCFVYKKIVTVVFLLLMTAPINAWATRVDLGSNDLSVVAPDLPQNLDATSVLNSVIGWLLGLISLMSLAAIIWGGVMYVSSLGDETKTKKAKNIIFWAIVGLAVAVLSYVIIKTVTGMFV